MTWVLSNGSNSREFATEEAAQDAKAELAGLGGDLTIERQSSEDNDNDEVEAAVIDMSVPDTSETPTNDECNSNGGCPACGEEPETVYRCQCGYDLAGVRSGVGTGGDRP